MISPIYRRRCLHVCKSALQTNGPPVLARVIQNEKKKREEQLNETIRFNKIAERISCLFPHTPVFSPITQIPLHTHISFQIYKTRDSSLNYHPEFKRVHERQRGKKKKRKTTESNPPLIPLAPNDAPREISRYINTRGKRRSLLIRSGGKSNAMRETSSHPTRSESRPGDVRSHRAIIHAPQVLRARVSERRTRITPSQTSQTYHRCCEISERSLTSSQAGSQAASQAIDA